MRVIEEGQIQQLIFNLERKYKKGVCWGLKYYDILMYNT
ncbi:MAG: hypothetical protein JWR02_2289 [Mucilaginibacter sp.]|nr:hypothetical protein [Mucilaginibacter sp.]